MFAVKYLLLLIMLLCVGIVVLFWDDEDSSSGNTVACPSGSNDDPTPGKQISGDVADTGDSIKVSASTLSLEKLDKLTFAFGEGSFGYNVMMVSEESESGSMVYIYSKHYSGVPDYLREASVSEWNKLQMTFSKDALNEIKTILEWH